MQYDISDNSFNNINALSNYKNILYYLYSSAYIQGTNSYL